MSCDFFQIPPGGQVTFCETKRHLAVAKATEIPVSNLGFQPLINLLDSGYATICSLLFDKIMVSTVVGNHWFFDAD